MATCMHFKLFSADAGTNATCTFQVHAYECNYYMVICSSVAYSRIQVTTTWRGEKLCCRETKHQGAIQAVSNYIEPQNKLLIHTLSASFELLQFRSLALFPQLEYCHRVNNPTFTEKNLSRSSLSKRDSSAKRCFKFRCRPRLILATRSGKLQDKQRRGWGIAKQSQDILLGSLLSPTYLRSPPSSLDVGTAPWQSRSPP